MKRLLPLFAAALLVFALIFVVHRLDNAAPADHDEDETPAAQATSPAAPTASTDSGEELPPEEMVGSAGAKYKFTVGWYYDETNQSNTKPLLAALQAVKALIADSDGHASVEIVDVDVPPEDRSPNAQAVTEAGLGLNGVVKPAFAGNPGQGMLTAQDVSHIINLLSQDR